MRDMRERTCHLCGHDEVIIASPTDFSGDADQAQRPLALAHRTESSFLGGTMKRADRPYGLLHTCTCRRCGFTQWFAKEPHAVPPDAPGVRIVRAPRPETPEGATAPALAESAYRGPWPGGAPRAGCALCGRALDPDDPELSLPERGRVCLGCFGRRGL